ncbi:MAG: hypothetical protein JWL84_3351 [Rhodospirillales bacterium]|nr:hypothetical protein [Rhodospirillales bacterium]
MSGTPGYVVAHRGFEFRPPAPAAGAAKVMSSATLARLVQSDDEQPARRRRKIWEMEPALHCSIIGTCLSTAELRHVVAKAGGGVEARSNHELHGHGVGLGSRHDGAAKLLNKALDQRHRLAIHQFDKAKTEEEVRALWREARQKGEIPGAYWAALTHPATTKELVRTIFGEVHMLSHLVGAANRADIRRLCQLETENAELQAKVGRQQTQLRDAILARDATICGLRELLAERVSAPREEPGPEAAASTVPANLIPELARQLHGERKRRAALEGRIDKLRAELTRERELRTAAEQKERCLHEELEALEADAVHSDSDAPETVSLSGTSVLYVGGRANQVAALRATAERCGATVLHHDGGIEDRGGRLAGLVSRADVVMFPVNCVSHDAALMVKRLCRQSEKRFIPLRSSGVASFLVALGRIEASRSATQA